MFRQVLEEFPQLQVIIFPCFFLDKASVADELLEMARKKDVGAIGMKAFGAGSVFGPKSRQRGPGKPNVDPRGHVLLKKMLAQRRISAIIPGVGVPEQLDENIKASQACEGPNAEQEGRAIRQCMADFYANLAPEYAWLRRWGAV